MFRYRLHSVDGDDLGESAYAMQIQTGDVIHHDGSTRYRVLRVVAFDEPDAALTGLLEVEPDD